MIDSPTSDQLRLGPPLAPAAIEQRLGLVEERVGQLGIAQLFGRACAGKREPCWIDEAKLH
jgi:hypothetical protein